MDTAEQYRVVFRGQVREGFDPAKVRETLGRSLRLSAAQAEMLFSGEKKHTLKRTASEEEAKRYVVSLAKLGAIAGVEKPGSEKQKRSPKAVKGASRKDAGGKTDSGRTTPYKYSPRPRNFLFKPLLYLSATLEVALTVFYVLLLLILSAGVFYYSLFTLWATALVGHPLLAMVVQLFSFIVGFMLLFLLAKPILSLQQNRYRGVCLTPEQEPDIHMFVADLCDSLDLPLPREIRINNDSTVRLRHYRGPVGFWKGESVLYIGAPLLASMNTSQMAGLIVRAIYCFRPRLTPRASFIVLASNQWQHNAVYREDMVDRWLKRWQAEGKLSDGPVNALQTLFEQSRRLMAVRLRLSRALERPLVHRLITEADKRAFVMTGSEGFSHMFEQQRVLRHTARTLIPKLQHQWQERGELPEDLIQLIIGQARRFPPAIHAKLRQQQEQKKAQTGDIIPSDAQRIRSLSKLKQKPGYDCLSPAFTLLRYFPKLARTMSLRFYHNRLRVPITPDKLTHVVQKGSMEEAVNQSIATFFNENWFPQLPLKMGLLLHGLNSNEEARNQWEKSLKRIERDFNHAQHEHRELIEAEETLIENSIREAMLDADLWRELGEGKPRKGELDAFYQSCRDNESRIEESQQKVRQHLKPYAQRLVSALALLKLEPTQSEDAERYREADKLIRLYDRLDAVLPSVRELKLHVATLQVLLSYRSGKKQPKLADRIEEQTSDVRQLLTSIRASLKDVDNPYPTPHGGQKLMDYLLLESYTEDTPDGDFDRGNDVFQRLTFLQKRILARLIAIAEGSENQHL